jgi:hypothetical protein
MLWQHMLAALCCEAPSADSLNSGFVCVCSVFAGGHLNPAVTFSCLLCGFYPVLHSILYIALQVSWLSPQGARCLL